MKNWGSWNASEDTLALGYITRETHIRELLGYYSLSVRQLWSCPVLEYYPYLSRNEDPQARELDFVGKRSLLTADQWPTIRSWGHVQDAARDIGPRGNYHPGPATLKSWTEQYLIPGLAAVGVS